MTSWTNLNTGTGEACAGQDMAALSFSFLVMVWTLFSDGNLGKELPIGSKWTTKDEFLIGLCNTWSWEQVRPGPGRGKQMELLTSYGSFDRRFRWSAWVVNSQWVLVWKDRRNIYHETVIGQYPPLNAGDECLADEWKAIFKVYILENPCSI